MLDRLLELTVLGIFLRLGVRLFSCEKNMKIELNRFVQFCETTPHREVLKVQRKRHRDFLESYQGSSTKFVKPDGGGLTEEGESLIRRQADEAIQEVAPDLDPERRIWLQSLCYSTLVGLGPLDLLLELESPILDLVLEADRPIRILETEEGTYRELPISYFDQNDWRRSVDRICAPNGWRIDQKHPVLQSKWRGWTLEVVYPSPLFGGEPRTPWMRLHRDA